MDMVSGCKFWPTLHKLPYSSKYFKGTLVRLGNRAQETLCVTGSEVKDTIPSHTQVLKEKKDWKHDFKYSKTFWQSLITTHIMY